MQTQRPGRMIVLEGIDGCGKTTVGQLIAESLRASFRYSVSDWFARWRSDVDRFATPTARFLFYTAAVVALQPEIEADLAVGDLILDRYIDSTVLTHQAMGVDTSILDLARLPVRVPDRVYVLRVDRKERRRRLRERNPGGVTENERLKPWEDALEACFYEPQCYQYRDRTVFLDNSPPHDSVQQILDDLASLGRIAP